MREFGFYVMGGEGVVDLFVERGERVVEIF